MKTLKQFRTGINILLIFQLIASFMMPAGALAAPLTPRLQETSLTQSVTADVPPTTLSVTILSTPYATLDSNSPSGAGRPRVFVVEAAVKNETTNPAYGVRINLDYQPDVANNWVLLPGEDPQRVITELKGNATYYAYWFVTYSLTIGASHQYKVSAYAENALPAVETPLTTVITRSSISTGNSGVTQTAANVTVGTAFTLTVTYDLGTNPQDIVFSPVGNSDFNPGAYRLISTKVRFYNDSHTQEDTKTEQLYFSSVGSFADNADATYVFRALTASEARLCAYTAVGYANVKYDQFYCDPNKNTVVDIHGSISLQMVKKASSEFSTQNSLLTYTIQYTNTGTLPLSYVWIWDDIDTTRATLLPATVQPPSYPNESTASRVAWYIGNIGVPGQANSHGTLKFTVRVGGTLGDIPNGDNLVNSAHFGINEGVLPNATALLRTISTRIDAPTISISKTDNHVRTNPDALLAYNIHVQNTGAIPAVGVVITDVLPAYLTVGKPSPGYTINGQTVVWKSLANINPGGLLNLTIPVTVTSIVANGTVLTNTASIQYDNAQNYRYAVGEATDTTIVDAPKLTISKQDYPDPVLIGNNIEYTLSYRNEGLSTATDVVISDVVPANTSFVTCSGCTQSGDTVSWHFTSLAPGASGSVKFSVKVSSSLPSGALITNDDYGISAHEQEFYAGAPVTTVVNHIPAMINGFTYVDVDGDGSYDAGDSPLPGVGVTAPQALPPKSVTSDVNGAYRFRLETEEDVQVTAADMVGYFRTTPGTVNIRTTLGITKTVNFGYAPNTSGFGVVYGTVFEDKDHDTSLDTNEGGIPTVTLTSSGAAVSPVKTNNLGQYTFRYILAGDYTINETTPNGYVSTTPTSVNKNVAVNSSNGSPVDFGNFAGIKITGIVFNDANVNGVKDLTEVGLSGATISAGVNSVPTSSQGEYTLYASQVGGGPLQIHETNPAFYVSTQSIPVSGLVRIDADTLQITAPAAGQTFTGVNFGDALEDQVVYISGKVWNDNGAGGGGLANGIPDGLEPGLPGAKVQLSSGITQTTGDNGLFSIPAPVGTALVITEVNPAGYFSTNALPGLHAAMLDYDRISVDALSTGQESTGNWFGDVLTSSVAFLQGKVYEDLNENGALDAGEPGMAGIKVTLQGEASEVTFTNASGEYSFVSAPGVPVFISSAGPGGNYHATSLENVMVIPPAAGPQPGPNFGYSQDKSVTSIVGVVFDDLNGNGEQDLGEPGIAGAQVSLNGALTQTTTTDGLVTGTFAFSVSTLNTFAVREKNPDGYRSTTPDTIMVVVDQLGASKFVLFGDTNSTNMASIYGTVYDDLNGNGVRDQGENGMPGVIISITVGTGGVITDVTKAYGEFTYGFNVNTAGYHTVSSQDPVKPGYHSTTPDQVNVLVVLGNSYPVDFGDTTADMYSIQGTVFKDDSGDGIQDAAELGIEDVLITLSDGSTTRTGPYGNYSLPVDDVGPLMVVESDPTGFHSTTPNRVSVDVVAGRWVYVVNYGDDNSQAVSSFYGTVFDDQNVNAAWDPFEPGIEGVEVNLNNASSLTTHTNEWGQFTFLIEATGPYTITEVDPAGWVSTGAIPADPSIVKIDNNTMNVVFNQLGSELGNNLFADAQQDQVVTISGAVWNDNGAGGGTPADGLRNGSEPGLPGSALSLTSGMATVSGLNGAFTLYAPKETEVTLTQVDLDGFVSTGAIAGNDAAVIDDSHIKVNPLLGGSASANNLFGDTVYVDLKVEKAASTEQVVAGVDFTYTITATSLGPGPSLGVVVTDTLPAVTIKSWAYDKGVSFTPATGIWRVGALAADEVAVLKLRVAAQPQVTGLITNTVDIEGDVYDQDQLNNRAEAGVLVTAAADLQITKSVLPATPVSGGVIQYTLDYANLGPSTAAAVRITDTLPLEVEYGGLFSQPADWTGPEIKGKSLIWTSTSLNPGAAGSIVFTGTIDTNAVGPVTNEAWIMSSTADGNLLNNHTSVETALNQIGSVNGIVFNDANGNGSIDTGEVGIAGVTVKLDGSATDVTDQNGAYSFASVPAGPHVVVETDLPGYFSTTANEIPVPVISNQASVVNFGDAVTTNTFASINGVVFNDANGNGLMDASETGLAGVTIHLNGSSTKTTDIYGAYQFKVVEAGIYTVVEDNPPGFFSTTPDKVSLTIALGHGYLVDFGDAPNSSNFANILGTVFEDKNRNGEWDGNETGVAGVTIKLDNASSVTTGAHGGFTFKTTVAGSHNVSETDLDGYVSTTPNLVAVTVAMGNSYEANFGDYLTCACSVDPYEEDDQFGEGSIQFGQNNKQTRNFCDDASDWMSFTVKPNTTYTITTSALGQRADTFLTLFGPQEQEVMAGNDDFKGNEDYSSRITWRAGQGEGGVYNLDVTNQAGVQGCYTNYTVQVEQGPSSTMVYLPVMLKPAAGALNQVVEDTPEPLQPAPLSPAGVINHSCPDTFEVDDTWEQAVEIKAGDSQIHSFDSDTYDFSADKDHVWFDLKAADTVIFNLPVITNTNTVMELFDIKGDALNITGTKQIKWKSEDAGKFYLVVRPLTATSFGCSATNGYVLTMEKIAGLAKIFLPVLFNNLKP